MLWQCFSSLLDFGAINNVTVYVKLMPRESIYSAIMHNATVQCMNNNRITQEHYDRLVPVLSGQHQCCSWLHAVMLL